MNTQNKHSGKDFIKVSAITPVAMVNGTVLSNCAGNTDDRNTGADDFPYFKGIDYQPSDGVAGLLFSQTGYELGFPVRIIVRLPKKELLQGKTICKLIPVSKEKYYKTECSYWGEIWKSHWWVAEFQNITEAGEWNIDIRNNHKTVFHDKGLRIGKNILWNSSVEFAAASMLESRMLFTKVGAGWQDAGTLWIECPAQSAMVIALEDLLEKGSHQLDNNLTERIHKQVNWRWGCI